MVSFNLRNWTVTFEGGEGKQHALAYLDVSWFNFEGIRRRRSLDENGSFLHVQVYSAMELSNPYIGVN